MVLFQEVQRFRQPWIWAILLGVAGWFTWGVWYQLAGGEPFGLNPLGDAGLLLVWVLSAVLLPGLFVLARLRTEVREDGVHVRFSPFHLRERSFRLDALARVEAVEYNPLLEYGGWGIRIGPRGWAYNVSGRLGVRLTFTDGRTLLIGSEKPEALADAVAEAQAMLRGPERR